MTTQHEDRGFIAKLFFFILGLFLGIFKAIFKTVFTLIILYGVGFYALMFYLDAHPEKKAYFEQKKQAIFGMIEQLDEVSKIQHHNDKGDMSGISSSTIPKDMLKMAKTFILGDDSTQEPKPLDPNSIPHTLKQVDMVLKDNKNYGKIRPKLTVKSAGQNGEGALKILDTMLGSKNAKYAEAAYNSLILIATEDAIEILHKHGY